MRTRNTLFFSLLLRAVLFAAPLHAQASSWRTEITSGAILNVALRGPWIDSGWRKPIPRLALAMGTSAAYERFIDQNGWSWKDVGQRAVGYLITETLIDVVKSKFK